MKLGIIGDAHLGCADYTERRRADFSQAFKNAIDLCVREGAEAICLLGDVFDSALTRRSVDVFAATMREVGPALDALKRGGIPVLAIAGNHEFGRGREAGELGVLESVGLLRVLRGEEVVLGGCGVIGFPWHAEDEVRDLPSRVGQVMRQSKAKQRILLLHNFVKGSAFLPSHLGEVEHRIADGFDRVFVGHHHDHEELGPFSMPGATEVQNLAEADQSKSVVIYDSARGETAVRTLPKTRNVVVLSLDVADHDDRDALFASLAASIASTDVSKTFVCVRLRGQTAGWSVTKAEITALLRRLAVVDRFVEVRTTTPTQKASDAIRGNTIDGLLSREFGRDAAKARRYVADCTDDAFAAGIIEEILR